MARSYVAPTLWLLGYPAQARQQFDVTLTQAETLAHPASWAQALANAFAVPHLLHHVPAAQGVAETITSLSAEQHLLYLSAAGRIRRGWVLTAQGQGEEGLAQMDEGLAASLAAGIEALRSYHLALLAEGYARVGQPEAGLRAVAEALTFVACTGERFYAAELSRLQGELTLQHAARGWGAGPPSPSPHAARPTSHTAKRVEREAEGCFSQAIEIARQQQAKSLELRAAMSLARLWQRQGKRPAAAELLAPVYAWFTEGFDTTDLQEARALLGALEA